MQMEPMCRVGSANMFLARGSFAAFSTRTHDERPSMNAVSNTYRILLLALGMSSCFVVHQAVFAQSTDERQRLDALDLACLKAREARLSVVQRQKIEECVNEAPEARSVKKSRKECEAFWRDYGWTIPTPRGGARPNLFADLPECVLERSKHDNSIDGHEFPHGSANPMLVPTGC
jgi:hypothetical protein